MARRNDRRRQRKDSFRPGRDQQDDDRRRGRDNDQRDDDRRRERDVPSRRSSRDSSYSTRDPPPWPNNDRDRDRDRDRERDRPRDRSRDSVRSRDSYRPPRDRSRDSVRSKDSYRPRSRSPERESKDGRRRSRSPLPPRRVNQIINNDRPGGARPRRLSPPRRERDSDRNVRRLSPLPEERGGDRRDSRSGRNSPAHSTRGDRTPLAARITEPSRAPSRVSSRAPSRSRSPPRTRAPVRVRSPIRARQDDRKAGKLSPLPKGRGSERGNAKSRRPSPAPSTTGGDKALAPAKTKQPSRAPSRAPSPVRPKTPVRAPAPAKPAAKPPAKAPTPVSRPTAAPAPASRATPAPKKAAAPAKAPAPAARPVPASASRPAPAQAASKAPSTTKAPAPAPRPTVPAQATKAPAPKPKSVRNNFHFLELAILLDLVLQDSHVLQKLENCINECEKEDPKTPWEKQEKGKEFLKWFEEYRSSVTKLKPVAPPLSVGNQVMRNHAVLAMKDMLTKNLTAKKLFTELFPKPPKEGEPPQLDPKNKPVVPKPTIDVSTDVICLLRPSFLKRTQYMTFAPYHHPTPSNVLITSSATLTNLAGAHPFTLVSAWPSLSGLKRVAFLWDNIAPTNGPGPLPADLSFLYPGNLPGLETIYILHPEIRPRSEWFYVAPECDTFKGGEGSEALFVEVREVDVEGAGAGAGTKGGSMWEVLGEENGKGKKDVWGRGGGGEMKVSEGVRDALREVRGLEKLYQERVEEMGMGGRKVRVKLLGCIPIKT
ncbi:hypothetical protein B0T20DRAFT_491945 [Sordaria brevicollis]|uniref:Uncharacterized protein n=1 Tax=Sordaria brevicollis TaxID=83679 RepID=A0AAE0PKA0_SORBR|nr:hypothetical protein B0T20DRAFT_491945 [Sordaria brevicollis]